MSSTSHTSRDAANHVIEKLREQGHQALLAGGCVRDMLLKRVPKDYDIATNAEPKRVLEIFPRAHQVGAKFGVMLVKKYGFDIEVATFRTDGKYSDGRHPDEVTFGTDVEDAHRRDFTINGLFFDPALDIVIDHVDGQSDLQAGIIRTIGDPDQRFTEDHLRLLRAIRFSAKLGFKIEPRTYEAIRQLAPHLSAISPERIWMELAQILTSSTRAVGWTLLVETGLRNHLIAGWDSDPQTNSLVLERMKVLPDTDVDSALIMACLFLQDNPVDVTGWCRALRLSNRLCNSIEWLIRSLRVVLNETALELADLKIFMAHANFNELLDLMCVDLFSRKEGLDVYHKIKERVALVAEERITPPPLLNGDELSAMGMKPGPKFGDILKKIYRDQLNEKLTTKKQAAELAKEWMEIE